MDRLVPSSDFQLDPAPSDRAMPLQFISKKGTETPSSSPITPGALVQAVRHGTPCSVIENWASSISRGPGMMMACQHPNGVGTSPSYSMGPSHPSTEMVASSAPRLVIDLDAHWPTSFTAPSSTTAPLQTALHRSHDYNGPSELVRETDAGTFNPDPSDSSSRRRDSPSNQSERSGSGHSSSASPPSSPSSVSSSGRPETSSQQRNSRECGSGRCIHVLIHEALRTTPESDEETCQGRPYSLLIYQALRSAPDMKLPLQGIYTWFIRNTDKGKDRNSKGWQNSIRHNLSMNAVRNFLAPLRTTSHLSLPCHGSPRGRDSRERTRRGGTERKRKRKRRLVALFPPIVIEAYILGLQGFEAIREESGPGKKSVNYWRLTDEAIKNGIQSTTRYRKQANYRKSLASDPPVRQQSGAQGGKTTKITANFRGPNDLQYLGELKRQRTEEERERRAQKLMYRQNYYSYPSPTTTVLPTHVLGSDTPVTRSPAQPFNLGSVVGNADPPPSTPMFCDMAGPAPDGPAMDDGFMGWGTIQSFSSGMSTESDISSDHEQEL